MPDDLVFYDRWGAVVAPTAQSVVRPRSAIHVVAQSRNDAVLLVWPGRGHGTIQLPGGGIEAGETPDSALAREWDEETGLPFAPLSPALRTHRFTHGFYNENLKEFWIFDQTFWLCDYDAIVQAGSPWVNPEGDKIAWEPMATLGTQPLSHAYKYGIAALLPQVVFAGISATPENKIRVDAR